MSGAWVKRRFWAEATVAPGEDGFGVHLDGRPLRTPARAALCVPTRALAELIAAEWRAQAEVIDPEAMPATRAANSAIDKLQGQMPQVVAMLADYGDSDLVCYRAEAPEGLVAAEAAAWDPLVDWVATRYGAWLAVHTGVMHQPQRPEALAALRVPVAAMSAFELAGFHDLVTLTGSLVIGLATATDRAAPLHLWDAAQVDTNWQIAQWGTDEEAQHMTEARRRAFLDAKRFFDACQRT